MFTSTRDYKQTIIERAKRDPKFAEALVDEAAALLLNGEAETALIILRDIVSVTSDFVRVVQAVYIESAGKDIVISDYQTQSRQDGLEIERLKKELAAMTEAEHAISNAYVELRVIIGAMDPPSTEFNALTKYVAGKAESLVKELAEAVESTKEACAAEFDRRDGGTGIGFYDPHEPAEIIRNLSLPIKETK